MSRVNSPVDRRTFGQRLRLAREAVPLSMSGLAELAGTHKTTIARLEGDQSEPRPGSVVALARATRTSPEWLMTGGPERPPRVLETGGLDLDLYPGVVASGGARLELGAKGFAQVGEVGTAGILKRLRLAVASLQGVIAELEALNLRPADASVDELAGQVAQAAKSEAQAKGARKKKKAG